MTTRKIAAIVLLLIPIVLVLLWHLCNHGLPNDDAANYAETALRIATQFRQHGILSGLVAVLGTRGWRPIAFPPLAVPFLLLTGNDVVAACAATLLSIYVALTFYLYRLARLCCTEPLSAAAACAFVLSSPMIATFSVVFFSESAWLLFSVACVYHLLRSGPFRDPVHGAASGFCGALMTAIRPAESVVILATLLTVVVFSAIRSKKIDLRDSAIVIGVFSIPALLLLLSTWSQAITRPDIWTACLTAVIAGLFLARRRNASFVAFFGAFMAVTCIWWAAYMPALFAWAFDASFGKMAQITDKQPFSKFGQTLLGIFGAFGRLETMVVAGAAFFLIASAVVKARRKRDDATRPLVAATPPSLLLYTSSIALLLFVFLYATSGTDDPRRPLVAVALFMISVIALAAARSRLVLVAVLCSAGAQLVEIGRTVAGAPAWSALSGFGSIPAPHRQPDGNLDAARFLARYISPGNTVAVYTLALFQPDSRIYEPAALKIASFQEGNGLEIGYLWDTAAYNEVITRLRAANYRYLLLDSLSAIGPTGARMPYVQFASNLLQRIHAGLDLPGVSLITRAQLGGREQMLFQILPLKPPSGIDNAAASWNGSRAIASEEQKGFPASNLNDGTEAAWGSLEGKTDVYAGVVLPSPLALPEIHLRLFTPSGRPHLRCIRIVSADGDGSNGLDWQFVRARLKGSKAFAAVITVPPLPDNAVVAIEIDRTDPHWGRRSIWGFACLRSQGDRPNYLPTGSGVYVREVEFE